MKNRISIYLNMLIICLSICVISVGVYSLTSANLTITGSLGYVYHEKSITATAQNYSTTAGGALQSTATNLTISEPTYNSTYGSNMITITLPNDIYFKGIGWDAPHIEILVTVKNTEDTDKAVTLLFDDMEGLGYTRKVIESAETTPDNIITNHSSAIILSKGEQTTFRLTLKQSIKKTNLAVSKDELNIQLSVANYNKNSLPTGSTGTKVVDNITYTINADQTGWSATSNSSSSSEITLATLIQGLPVNVINGFRLKDEILNYKLTIPNSVTDILSYITGESYGDYYLPGSLINIYSSAFRSYLAVVGNLISKNYIYNFETIGNYAFSYNSFTELELQSENLKLIGLCAFQSCRGLTTVTLNEGLETISGLAFYDCSGLTSITIPSTMTSTQVDAFRGCDSLETIIIDSSNTIYDSRDNCNAIIETLTNTLIVGCKNTTIPSSVTSIGNFAFSSCSNLSTVTFQRTTPPAFGNSYVFNFCSALTAIKVPSSAVTAYKNVSNLSSYKDKIQAS